jgi:hypothetical protein
VRLTVTRDFGAVRLTALAAPQVEGEDTVMRLLARNTRVRTSYGGAFVESIGGLAGGRRGRRLVDWFYYVNGIEADRGATAARLHDGDRVWWDHHDWTTTMRVPAVVGAFPEPFLHGSGGRRYPVRIECVDPESRTCSTVATRLARRGIRAARGGFGRAVVQDTLRVLVGPWSALRQDPAARRVERGPSASGVFARMAADGRSLRVLDPRGAVTRTLGPGAGLVAAVRNADDQPAWLVTGTDEAGIELAGRALEEATLANRFAVALAPGRAIALPDRRPS